MLPRQQTPSNENPKMPDFKDLEIREWRQFDKVEIDLSERVTVLTGANGTGKTTLLSTLVAHFGWSLSFVATPRIGRKSARRVRSDLHQRLLFDPQDEKRSVQIGEIRYDTGEVCRLMTKEVVEANYSLKYDNLRPVQGLYIPSHRPHAVFSPIKDIPTNPVTSQQTFEEYQRLVRASYETSTSRNPGIVQKQSMMALAVFGEGNSVVAPNEEFRETLRRLEHALKVMLPKSLGFERIEVRDGDVVICTTKGDFSVDAMSGGVNGIFGLAWQLTMFGAHQLAFTIVIDEPENHLHPTMQRLLLPSMVEAFPDCRIIVATHSPFIITSFPKAAVYALDYNDAGRVVSQRLQVDDLSGTPNSVLREILDVDSNLPAWVETKVREILEDPTFDSDPKMRGERLMRELSRLGLAGSIAEYKA